MFLILSCIFGIVVVVVVATITTIIVVDIGIRVAINSLFLFSDRTNFSLGSTGALAETFDSQP